MSEITTGRVNIPATVIATPVVAAGLCINLASAAVRAGVRQWQRMQKEIEETEKRLLWTEQKDLLSPKSVATASRELYKAVSLMPVFQQVTRHMGDKEKSQFAASIVLAKSPLQGYVRQPMLDAISESRSVADLFNKAAQTMANEKFAYVKSIVDDAAKSSGFVSKQVHKNGEGLFDITFTDKQGHELTAYGRKDDTGNTKLMLDLHGYDCNMNDCSIAMESIVAYLHEHGIPYAYDRLKHNQPQGLLRGNLDRAVQDYLRKRGNNNNQQGNAH